MMDPICHGPICSGSQPSQRASVFAGVPTLTTDSYWFTSLKARQKYGAGDKQQVVLRRVPQSEFHKDLSQTKGVSFKSRAFLFIGDKQPAPPLFFGGFNLPWIGGVFEVYRGTTKKPSVRSFNTYCAASGPLATKPWAAARETASWSSSKADVKAFMGWTCGPK